MTAQVIKLKLAPAPDYIRVSVRVDSGDIGLVGVVYFGPFNKDQKIDAWVNWLNKNLRQRYGTSVGVVEWRALLEKVKDMEGTGRFKRCIDPRPAMNSFLGEIPVVAARDAYETAISRYGKK